jgi:hypothetical protein
VHREISLSRQARIAVGGKSRQLVLLKQITMNIRKNVRTTLHKCTCIPRLKRPSLNQNFSPGGLGFIQCPSSKDVKKLKVQNAEKMAAVSMKSTRLDVLVNPVKFHEGFLDTCKVLVPLEVILTSLCLAGGRDVGLLADISVFQRRAL